MPNWKKVVVSGSNADLNQLKLQRGYYVPLTGSGSVPAKADTIYLSLDTSSAGLVRNILPG